MEERRVSDWRRTQDSVGPERSEDEDGGRCYSYVKRSKLARSKGEGSKVEQGIHRRRVQHTLFFCPVPQEYVDPVLAIKPRQDK